MPKKILLALLVVWASAVFAPMPAAAQSADWRVTAREGIVRVRAPGESPRDAEVGESLTVGTIVTTGADSAATLENGAQHMTMSANSRMTIAQSTPGGVTRILQHLGSIFFQVDRQRLQHFRVETPRLAAVVKGTSFTVTVSPQFDLVAVTSGLVEVRANRGGAVREVPSGESVRIVSSAPSELVVNAGGGATSIGSGGAGDGAEQAQLRGGFAATTTEGADAAGGADLNGAARDPSRAAVGGGGGAQMRREALGNRSRAVTVQAAREGYGDQRGLVKFILLYLLGSFAVGFGFYCAVRTIERLGRESALKMTKRRKATSTDAS